MKNILLAFIFVSLFFSCNTTSKKAEVESEKIIYNQSDKEILEQIFELFKEQKNSSTSELIIKVGTYFKETPYVAHTLETDEEQLVVNLREMDCTTFAENCLAISKTIKSGKHTFEQFTNELKRIRYRNGEINGYPSRIHYFSDWIFLSEQKKIISDLSGDIGQEPYPNMVNFMSTHPESYKQLNDSSELVNIIAEQEADISNREMYYIPETKIAEVEDKLMDGDIAGITTGINGLNISHVVILIRKAGRIHLMHASSSAEKVVVSENTLENYLLNSNSATGIMVARPL